MSDKKRAASDEALGGDAAKAAKPNAFGNRADVLAAWKQFESLVGADQFNAATAYLSEPAPTGPAQVDAELVRRTIDQTLLKPDATVSAVEAFTKEALAANFFGVCVNSSHVQTVANIVKGSQTKCVSVVGFPLGACLTTAKAFETTEAVKLGADEIDMVLNIGAFKAKNYGFVLQDIAAVVQAAGTVPLKVILETVFLDEAEIVLACGLSLLAGAAFVKTSTGFSGGGATEAAIALMNLCVGGKLGIKASGGVRTPEQAVAVIKAGATRIGTSSGDKLIVVGGQVAEGTY